MSEELNPFEIAQRQLDTAAKIMQLVLTLHVQSVIEHPVSCK